MLGAQRQAERDSRTSEALGTALRDISAPTLLEIVVPSDYLRCGRNGIDLDRAGQSGRLIQESAGRIRFGTRKARERLGSDPEKRRDLSQDIHFQLWRSFQRYDSRCSLRTWTYRVAHHVAVSHVVRERRTFSKLVSLEQMDVLSDKGQGQLVAQQHVNLARLSMLIQRLKPLDRQVIVSWLEGLDATSISEITGLSPANVAVRIHRIKNILARHFRGGGQHAE